MEKELERHGKFKTKTHITENNMRWYQHCVINERKTCLPQKISVIKVGKKVYIVFWKYALENVFTHPFKMKLTGEMVAC